jgi:hypothetical protein
VLCCSHKVTSQCPPRIPGRRGTSLML